MPRGSGLSLLFASLLAVSFALPAAGFAASNETRGAFIESLLKSLSIKPQYPSTATFKDVPSSSPYYGYVEAAAKLGISNGFSNGTFGVNDPLTRAEAAKFEVVAFGDRSVAPLITATKFSDNAQIPTALVGYVGVAAQLGLLHGLPSGAFQPETNLTTAQQADLISQLKTAIAANKSATIRLGVATVSGKKQVVLTSASGMTLYYFTKDTSTSIACTGVCAGIWPPVTSSAPVAGPGVTGTLTVLKSANGEQVLYNDHAVYAFSSDTAPGQANGEGFKGLWYVATLSLGASGSGSTSTGGGW